ncbi:MAG: hypothetical protein DMF59_20335 [Acidobacteria bacterium]|nr:MAG: hypothetical protein DMF59_20335 [Acidobacteriota bacterium]
MRDDGRHIGGLHLFADEILDGVARKREATEEHSDVGGLVEEKNEVALFVNAFDFEGRFSFR